MGGTNSTNAHVPVDTEDVSSLSSLNDKEETPFTAATSGGSSSSSSSSTGPTSPSLFAHIRDKTKQKLDATKTAITGFVNPEPEPSYFPSLSFQERLFGFVICFAMGLLFTFVAWMSVLNWVRFGVFFTIGNILSLGSTAFLVGPIQFVKNACATRDKAISTGVYVVSFALTLLFAFWLHSGVLVILSCLVQYAAFLWYCLAYIPFAQRYVAKCCAFICFQ